MALDIMLFDIMTLLLKYLIKWHFPTFVEVAFVK
jgi:hypothetical protein